MTEKIEADYEALEQLASKFDAQANVIQQMMQNTRSRADNLHSSGWIGRGSDAFFAELLGEVLPGVQRLQQALEQANQVTKQVSATIKQAEDDACNPFKIRAI